MCNQVFEIFHLMSEECNTCAICQGVDCVEKIPSEIMNVKNNAVTKVGSLVKQHIEEAKEEIKKEKKRLSSKVFE